MTRGQRVALALGVLIALSMAWPTARAVMRLDAARRSLDALTTEVSRPPVAAVPPVIRADDAASASSTLAARLRTLAVRDGLLVERAVAAAPPASGIASVALAVSGGEKAVLGFADALPQQGGPRWRTWTIEAQPGGAVRLSGEVIAPWG